MKFAKYALATGLVATTVAGSVLVFNTDAAAKVISNIEALKSKIVAFASNDSKLVEKYNKLKDDAQNKINELERKLEENKNASEDEKNKLNEEINRLEGEVNKANLAIAELQKQSDLAVEEVANLNPTDASTLPGLDSSVEEESPVKAYFYSDRTQVTITLDKNINIGLLKKGNIEIKFYDKDGKWLETKAKHYAGYLNDSEGNKYGKGAENNEFSNELEAGKTYSSTRKIKSGEEVGKVIVTITDNDGKSESITINNK